MTALHAVTDDSIPDEDDALDAYSRAVTGVVDTLGPAVVSVDIRRGRRGGPDGAGSGVVVTPDGAYVITGSDDSTARVWKLADGTSIALAGHDGPIETMTLSSEPAA